MPDPSGSLRSWAKQRLACAMRRPYSEPASYETELPMTTSTSVETHTHSEPSPSEPSPPIALTAKAGDKVREIREAEGLGQQGLRVRVIGGGCSGFTYDLFFEDETTEFDTIFESEG